MPAKDKFHESFVRAIQKNGWTVTDDPLTIRVLDADLLIDIGAERMVGAERDGERIAVEIKSFISKSAVQDLKEAAGQFMLYEEALKRVPAHVDRVLLLAIRLPVYVSLFENGIGKILMDSHKLRLVVFDAVTEEITQWVPASITEKS